MLDESLPAAVRLIVLFRTLYAQPMTRVARLHPSQFAGAFSRVRFGDVWIELPDPMPTLLGEVFAARPPRDPNNHWLFPSITYARQPACSQVLTRRVTSGLGRALPDIRQDSLTTLVRGMEASQLARALGLSVATALKWAALCESPSWDQMLRAYRDLDNTSVQVVSIADRVATEYVGPVLTENPPRSRKRTRVSQVAMSDAAFEAFSYQRVAKIVTLGSASAS